VNYNIDHRAQIELSDAVGWYEKDSKWNAQRFVEAFRSLITEIIKMPGRFPPAFQGARQAKMKCYPYYVIYAVSPDTITILAVAHIKRRPGYWHDRLA